MSAALSILSMYADSDDEIEEQQTLTNPEETVKPQNIEIAEPSKSNEKRKIVLPDPDVLLSKKIKPNKTLIPPQLTTKRKNIVTESS